MGAAHKLIFWCMAEKAEGKMPDHGNRSKCQKHRKERKVPQKRKGPLTPTGLLTADAALLAP